MATRTRMPAARLPRTLLALGLTASVLAGTGLVATGSAAADPTLSIAQVEQRISSLNDQVDQAVEDFDKAELDLAAAQRKLAAARSQVDAAKARLAAIRARISAVAASDYRTGGGDPMLTLMGSSDPQQVLDQAATLDQLGRDQTAALAIAAAAQHDVAQQEQRAAQAVAKAEAIERHLAERKAFIERSLATEKHLLAGLKASARRQLAAQQAAAAARDRAAAARASRSASRTPIAPTPVTGSGGAAVAVQWAYRELGKPYVWGASGPNAFDCSGLTMYVWGMAGVSLPHSSSAQYGSGAHVSQSQVQPGDLVFFGSPIHHVGIYIGNGQMISAPHTGDVVKIQYAFRSDYAGAVRP